MKLHNGTYIWNPYPVQDSGEFKNNSHSQVVVMGGGISGVLIASQLVQEGFEVTILDRLEAGFGSTCASTAILQYELDVSLDKLIAKIGANKALLIYRESFKALLELKKIAQNLGEEVSFQEVPSLYLSSKKSDVVELKLDYLTRLEAGFELEWLDQYKIETFYPWKAESAILGKGSAVVDPVRLTLSLLNQFKNNGGKYFANITADKVEKQNAKIKLTLNPNLILYCDFLVVSCGYETQKWMPVKKGKLTSSYAIAVPTPANLYGWEDNAVVWETNRPYHYMRRYNNSHIIIGGQDLPFKNTFIRDLLLLYESYSLRKKLREMLRDQSLKWSHRWTGTFAESSDGIPFIGPDRDMPNVFYVFACGGNGITFSTMARKLVLEWLRGEKSELSKITDVYREE